MGRGPGQRRRGRQPAAPATATTSAPRAEAQRAAESGAPGARPVESRAAESRPAVSAVAARASAPGPGVPAARLRAPTARGFRPGLGPVLVGNDPGSRSYVAMKHRDCAEVGIDDPRVSALFDELHDESTR